MVRRCASAQREAAIEALALALRDDPQLSWGVTGEDRDERLRALIAEDVDAGLECDELWSTGELEAVATWSPPLGRAERIAEIVDRAAAERDDPTDPDKREACAEYDRVLASHLPEESAWYLEILGTRPEQRRRGYASALLGPGLSRCDREGVGALVDTSNPGALPFYEALGFELVTELRVGERSSRLAPSSLSSLSRPARNARWTGFGASSTARPYAACGLVPATEPAPAGRRGSSAGGRSRRARRSRRGPRGRPPARPPSPRRPPG